MNNPIPLFVKTDSPALVLESANIDGKICNGVKYSAHLISNFFTISSTSRLQFYLKWVYTTPEIMTIEVFNCSNASVHSSTNTDTNWKTFDLVMEKNEIFMFKFSSNIICPKDTPLFYISGNYINQNCVSKNDVKIEQLKLSDVTAQNLVACMSPYTLDPVTNLPIFEFEKKIFNAGSEYVLAYSEIGPILQNCFAQIVLDTPEQEFFFKFCENIPVFTHQQFFKWTISPKTTGYFTGKIYCKLVKIPSINQNVYLIPLF